MKKSTVVTYLLLLLFLPSIAVTYIQFETPKLERAAWSNIHSVASLKSVTLTNWLNERNGDI